MWYVIYSMSLHSSYEPTDRPANKPTTAALGETYTRKYLFVRARAHTYNSFKPNKAQPQQRTVKEKKEPTVHCAVLSRVTILQALKSGKSFYNGWVLRPRRLAKACARLRGVGWW